MPFDDVPQEQLTLLAQLLRSQERHIVAWAGALMHGPCAAAAAALIAAAASARVGDAAVARAVAAAARVVPDDGRSVLAQDRM